MHVAVQTAVAVALEEARVAPSRIWTCGCFAPAAAGTAIEPPGQIGLQAVQPRTLEEAVGVVWAEEEEDAQTTQEWS